ASGRNHITSSSEPFEWLGLRQRGQHGYRSTPIRYLDRLTSLDAPQQLAGTLAEFTHADCCHVLFVAHLPGSNEHASKPRSAESPRWDWRVAGDALAMGPATEESVDLPSGARADDQAAGDSFHTP